MSAGLPAHLLGRHVAHRPENHARLGAARDRPGIRLAALRAVQLQLGEAEVEDLDPSVLREEDVLGLQVPVHDPLFVRGGQTLRHLHRVVDRFARRDRTRTQPAAQRLAFEKLRHDVRRAVARVRPEVVDGRDVRVVERSRRPCLLLEAFQAVGVLRERRRQHLDRDLARKPWIARAIDLPHPARADGREDLVGTELRSSSECHVLKSREGPCATFPLPSVGPRVRPPKADPRQQETPSAGRRQPSGLLRV